MPAISTPKPDADSFLIMATEVHKLLTRPVGTEHARIRQLAKVLRDLANTNYDRGWNDALEAGGVMAAPHPHVGKTVRIKKGRLFVRGDPDPKFGVTDVEVDEGEYELVSSEDSSMIDSLGQRLIPGDMVTISSKGHPQQGCQGMFRVANRDGVLSYYVRISEGEDLPVGMTDVAKSI